jgi:hypothetical protein
MATKEPVASKQEQDAQRDPRLEVIWTKTCKNCGETPVVKFSGMCGPCTFGEADTLRGGW